MRARLKRWWPVVKIVLAVAILVLVGVRFRQDLARPELLDLSVRPAWLLLSALLYLAALGFSGWYWYWLLGRFGEKVGLLTALRAYYVSQLGKYVPGKALALVIRGALVRSAPLTLPSPPAAGGEGRVRGVKFGVAVITAFYEVLTTMASGALVAALLFTLWPPQVGGLDWDPVFFGLLLVGVAGVPLLPGVFNRLVQKLARRFQNVQSFQLPRLRTGTLLVGVGVTSVGWFLMGLSLWSLVQGLLPETEPLDGIRLARYTAMMSLSYVAGFMALVVPSGVGVREYILSLFLPAELTGLGPAAVPQAVVTILVLRLVWTTTELLVAAVLYFWPGAWRYESPLAAKQDE